jgi:hypothetical protein
MFFISCWCCSIGFEQVNPRAEIQGGSFDSFVEPQVPDPSAWADDRLPGSSRKKALCVCVCVRVCVCGGGGEKAPFGPRPQHYRGFTITLRHTTLGKTPLDEWLVWRRDLYLTTHTTQKRQTSVSPVGFEPATLASEWPQTHALDGAARGIGRWYYIASKIAYFFKSVNQVIVIQCSSVRNFCWGVETGKQNALT